MCGILGVYGINNIDSYSFYEALKLQSNRGPDNVETTSLLHAQLGHARLSIHDTSSAANQPMVKDKERYSLIFNGEIYNFRELKKDLGPNYKFETDSDTEVLLFYLIKFGFDETLRKIEGMYAFSFYDSLSGDVYIARDRFGEKPVYYTLNNTSLTVSSSLFSIVSMHGLEGLNLQSVSNYLHYGYCKNEETTAQGINRLKPGGFIKYNVLSHCFIKGDYEQEVPKTQDVDLEVSLKESVRKCLDSDVPVGCFLSGGIDSSLIASYISELSPSVNAYTIGFEDKNYDESDAAEIVATHLGISLKTLVLAESDLVRVIDETNWVFDEPFADASYLAMYELSKFARKDVTVCLSGDGADELFSGYNRHVLIPKIYRKLNLVPYRVRNLLSHLIQNSRLFRRVLHFFYVTVLKESSKVNAFDEKLDKLSVIIGFKDKPDLLFRVLAGKDYSELLGFPKPYRLQIENIEPRTLSKIDLKSYLHEDVLTKVDRCTDRKSVV